MVYILEMWVIFSYDTKIATEIDDISDVLERCSERMNTNPDDLQSVWYYC